MRIFRSSTVLCLFALLLFSVVVRAQDEQRVGWQVTQFDVTATVPPSERSLNVHAQLTVRNAGRTPLSSVSLRLSPKITVSVASVNNATATFRPTQEKTGNLQVVRIALPSAVEAGGKINVALDYRYVVAENSGLAALSPTGSQFLPLSFWYPTPNNPFILRTTDTAPFRLTVNTQSGEMIVASGKANGAAFEQTLNAQPFFVTGNWDVAEGTGDARGASAWLPKGASSDERKQADALIALASGARSFYAGLLGPSPDVPLRLVAVRRGAGLDDAGTVLLDEAAFRRTKVDSVTAMLVAEAVARLWIGGVAPVRGEGEGVLREGLPRFLAALYLEKQFGRETADTERQRERAAYAAIARRDPPLTQTTQLDETYFTSVANKGAMIWRLADRALGHDVFMTTLRTLLQNGRDDGLTLAQLRARLSEQGGANLKALLGQELDQPTDTDLLIGLPQQRGGQWSSALRNLGSIDVTVPVVATTNTGERLTVQATIPARNFSEAVFKTSSPITRVEIDPDKLYPQIDYTNDVQPRARLTEDALAEGMRLFAQQQYPAAETMARDLLAITPRSQEARILLARAELAEGKLDEAEKEFRALLDEKLPTPGALGWANVGLGEILLKRNQPAEAVKRFNEAVRAEAEYGSTLAAHAGRIRAEAASGAPPAVDDVAQKFIAQLDAAIKSGRKADLEALIVPGELSKFSSGVIASQPEVWQTRVLHTEQLDAAHIAADVSLNTRALGRDQSGTAVLILARVGGSLKLAGVEFFEVH